MIAKGTKVMYKFSGPPEIPLGEDDVPDGPATVTGYWLLCDCTPAMLLARCRLNDEFLDFIPAPYLIEVDGKFGFAGDHELTVIQ